MPVRARLVLGVLSIVSMALAIAPPVAVAEAVATTEAADALPKDAGPVAIRVQDLTARLEVVRRSERAVSAALEDAELAVQLTKSQVESNSVALESVKDRLRQRAAVAYQRHGATSGGVLDVERARDLGAADRYASATADVDARDVADLTRMDEDLRAALAERIARRDDLARRHDDLAQQEADLTTAEETARDQLHRWGAVPVMGESTLSAAQLAGWFESTGALPRLDAGTTILDVARYFVEEGNAEHVRGDLAFAQAIIETGSFGVAAGNNFSGIGVCDSCQGGYGFPTPRDGVRAQIQLLRNYADPASTADDLAYPPSPALYGSDPQKAARLYDTFFLKGKAPLWNLMGGGNWATDPTYAPKVIGLYAQMLAWADAHGGSSG
jgi:hypothetical protein